MGTVVADRWYPDCGADAGTCGGVWPGSGWPLGVAADESMQSAAWPEVNVQKLWLLDMKRIGGRRLRECVT